MKRPWTLERALAFKSFLPKYRGRTLREIISIHCDVDYLRFVASKRDGNIAVAAGIVISHLDSTCSDVSSRTEKPTGEPAPVGSGTTPL
jgi:hypothetical protein